MEYKFKEGQVYKIASDDVYTFNKGQVFTVLEDSHGECYILNYLTNERWYDMDFNDCDLELIRDVSTPTPVLINVENLMEHIVTNKLESNEILSYLQGYVEGARF